LIVIVAVVLVYVFFFHDKGDDGFIERETHVAQVRESTQPATLNTQSLDIPSELDFINTENTPLKSYMETKAKNEDVYQRDFSYQIPLERKESESTELQSQLKSLGYEVTTQDFEDGGMLFYGLRGGESVIVSLSPDQENLDMMLVTVTYESKS